MVICYGFIRCMQYFLSFILDHFSRTHNQGFPQNMLKLTVNENMGTITMLEITSF